MEEEIVTTNQDYCYCLLHDLLDMVIGKLGIIYTDKKLNSLFRQLTEYVSSKTQLPYDGDIIDISVAVTQKK